MNFLLIYIIPKFIISIVIGCLYIKAYKFTNNIHIIKGKFSLH